MSQVGHTKAHQHLTMHTPTPTAPPKQPKPDRQARRSGPFHAPDTVVWVKRNARISPKKLNLIAHLVRRMTARDALLQCGISDKKAGRIAYDMLHDALECAKARGFDIEQMVIGACA